MECSQRFPQILLGDGPCLCLYNGTDMTRVPPSPLPLSSADTHCSEQEASGQEEEDRVDMYTIFCMYGLTVENMHLYVHTIRTYTQICIHIDATYSTEYTTVMHACVDTLLLYLRTLYACKDVGTHTHTHARTYIHTVHRRSREHMLIIMLLS